MSDAWKEVLLDIWFFFGLFWPMAAATYMGAAFKSGKDPDEFGVIFIFIGIGWMFYWVLM